jgi:CHAT domain-containing protein
MKRQFLRVLFLSSLIACLSLGQGSVKPWTGAIGQPAMAQSADTAQLVQQGVDRYQTGDLTGALTVWKAALTRYAQSRDRENEAIVVENLARTYQHLGQSEAAIDYWRRGVKLYHQLGNLPQVGRLLVEQAQAHSHLGQSQQAIDLLCQPNPDGQCRPESALQIARTAQVADLEAAALGSLGDAYRLSGNFNAAIETLQASLNLAQTIDHPAYQISALNSLGNAYSSRAQRSYRRASSALQAGSQRQATSLQQIGTTDDAKALEYLRQSLELARSQNNLSAQLRSLLSAIPLHYRTNDTTAATTNWQAATQLLARLPDSRERVYAAIDLARLLQPIAPTETVSLLKCPLADQSVPAEALLQQAIAIAQRIQDPRAESFALGGLGRIYECRRDYPQALSITASARLSAEQDLQSKDSLYLWEWQTARILKAQRQPSAAIAAYEQALATLEAIRSDILNANRDVQFDFRDTVEPIYRELVALRLGIIETATSHTPKLKPQNSSLTAVLNTMDSLKLAELQNYFGNDCVIVVANRSRNLSAEAQATATFHSIILDDRTAIVLTLPNQEQRIAWVEAGNPQLRQSVIQFRRGLETFFEEFNPKSAQQLYDWIVRPFEADLQQAQVKTLVFVQDGILRSVPMAALHDGNQFLIQKYAIATTLSLSLTDFRPADPTLRALAMGLTQSVTIDGRQFQALASVGEEIQAVTVKLPGSKPLLDDEFTRDRLRQELSNQRYSVIHIATHGEFGSDPEDTFLVTGDQQKLTITELDTLIRQFAQGQDTIDLLSLTACKTAVGEDRAALGLAGVAVQAGARSALASLWSINDAATADVATLFYAELHNGTASKAVALQQAQRSLIESGGNFTHPAYWAPFILVGNWL